MGKSSGCSLIKAGNISAGSTLFNLAPLRGISLAALHLHPLPVAYPIYSIYINENHVTTQVGTEGQRGNCSSLPCRRRLGTIARCHGFVGAALQGSAARLEGTKEEVKQQIGKTTSSLAALRPRSHDNEL